MLSMKKMKLEKMLGVAADRKDPRLFLCHIVNIHNGGAFSRKKGR